MKGLAQTLMLLVALILAVGSSQASAKPNSIQMIGIFCFGAEIAADIKAAKRAKAEEKQTTSPNQNQPEQATNNTNKRGFRGHWNASSSTLVYSKSNGSKNNRAEQVKSAGCSLGY